MADEKALKAQLVADSERFSRMFVMPGTELHKFVAARFAEMDVPMKGWLVKVDNETYDMNAMMDYEYKVLYVGKSLIASLPVEALRGVLKHEIQHYKQYERDPRGVNKIEMQKELQELKRDSGIISTVNYKHSRIAEAEADFAAGRESIEAIKFGMAKHPRDYNNDAAEHPSARNRLKMMLMKNAIEAKLGVALMPEDVDIRDNGEFSLKGIDTQEGRQALAATFAGRKPGDYAAALNALHNGGMQAAQKEVDAVLGRVDDVMLPKNGLQALKMKWGTVDPALISSAITPPTTMGQNQKNR